MESKAMKQVKKGKASTNNTNIIPPKRGQIKVKIMGELVETVVSIAAGNKKCKKHERGEDGQLLATGKAPTTTAAAAD